MPGCVWVQSLPTMLFHCKGRTGVPYCYPRSLNSTPTYNQPLQLGITINFGRENGAHLQSQDRLSWGPRLTPGLMWNPWF